MKCVICKEEIIGHACNPWPMITNGKCCTKCDRLHVTRWRLALRGIEMTEEQAKEVYELEEKMRQQFNQAK